MEEMNVDISRFVLRMIVSHRIASLVVSFRSVAEEVFCALIWFLLLDR